MFPRLQACRESLRLVAVAFENLVLPIRGAMCCQTCSFRLGQRRRWVPASLEGHEVLVGMRATRSRSAETPEVHARPGDDGSTLRGPQRAAPSSGARKRTARCRKRGRGRAACGGPDFNDPRVRALERLRTVLQSMEVPERRAAIQNLASDVQLALLAFMETRTAHIRRRIVAREDTAGRLVPADEDYPKRLPCTWSREAVRARTREVTRSTTHQARANIKALRLYTRSTSESEAAMERQAALAQIRHSLAAESALDLNFWDQPRRVLSICRAVLGECGTSEKELELRAFVHMRASRWLGQGYQIASPAMALMKALHWHARLLRARAASWEAFRAEWVCLMQCDGYLRRKRLTQVEAEAIADKARGSVLRRRLEGAVRSVERILHREERSRAAKAHARELLELAKVAKAKAKHVSPEECSSASRKANFTVQGETLASLGGAGV